MPEAMVAADGGDEDPTGSERRHQPELARAAPVEKKAPIENEFEIELDDDKSLDAIRKQLKPGGNGRILMRIARDQGKRLYEIDIGAGWQINPALAGAIKSFDGVVDVRLN